VPFLEGFKHHWKRNQTQPLHVLVVDDEQGVRALVTTYLTVDWHTVGEMPAGVDLIVSKPVTLGDFREALVKVVGE